MKLIIAAKVDPVDQEYYDKAIKPLIESNRPLVEYVGEVDDIVKDELLGGAYAYLFPIDWPEPFGLTMAESMATGTPVIAYRSGSVCEVVEDGVTGFCPTSLRGMIEAVSKVADLDRAACRKRVERLFSPKALADGYELAYAALGARGREQPSHVRQLRPARAHRPGMVPSPAMAWGNRTANYLRSRFQPDPAPAPQRQLAHNQARVDTAREQARMTDG